MRLSRNALSAFLSAALVLGLIPISPVTVLADAEEMVAEEAPVQEEDALIENEGETEPEPDSEGDPSLLAEDTVQPEETAGPEVTEINGSAPLRNITFDEEPGDDLLDGYIAQRLGDETSTDGLVLTAQSRPSGTDADVYDLLKDYICEVAAGKRTSTVFDVPASVITGSEKTMWTAADLGVSSILTADGMGISDEAIDALYDRVFPDYDSIIFALVMDCPYDLYWFDKSQGVFYGASNFGATNKGGQWSLYLRGDMTVQFAVSKTYAAGTYQVNTSTGARVEKAVATAKRIVSESAGKPAYERLKYFRSQICALVSYDYAAARGSATSNDPWQLINVFDGDNSTNVVCEGYAKAFKYLCDLAGIDGVECRLVTGTMSGGTGAGSHMWNVVRMPDGKNYLVDLTNCDSGTIGANDLLFVAPYASGSVSGGYTLKPGSSTIKYSYDADTRGFYTTDELTLSATKYDKDSGQEGGGEGEGSGQEGGGEGSGQEDVPQAKTNIAGAKVTASTQTYTGSAHTPTLTVRLGNKTLRSGTDFVVSSWKNNTNVGTASVTVTGKGDYEGTASGTFAIVARSLDGAGISAIADQAYTGSALTPVPTVKVGSTTLRNNTDYTISYKDNVGPGTATATITGKGNYAGSRVLTFKIVQKSLAEATVSTIANQAYTGSAVTPKPVVKIGSTALREGTDYKLTYKNNVSAGTATVVITGAGAYGGSKTVTFKIVAMKGTWRQSSGRWWYEWSNGTYPKSQFLDIDGTRYFFDAQGWMKTGWLQISGKWYYFSSDGSMAVGWKLISGVWYWFDSQGVMATGWKDISGTRYWFNPSGAMATGWQQISGKWYYFASSGAMYRDKWQGDYYLQSDGSMATNTWIGKYHVDANGKWDKTR